MSAFRGFAVVDTETTGILPGFHHRIAEIAVVHVDPHGHETGSWHTLVNPERDLGPQALHGIRAADVRSAPVFAQIAGDILALFEGRIVVAHNWSFDAMHLHAEFARIDIDSPFVADTGICTMRLAGELIPGSGRSLIECCAALGLDDREWHTAAADAAAAAGLLVHFLREMPGSVRVTDRHLDALGWPWPPVAASGLPPVHRRPVGYVAPHFLARIVDRIPRDGNPDVDVYLAMLDRALLDRNISDSEADDIVSLAHELGLSRAEAVEAHHTYLRALAHAAWEDGVVTADEHADVQAVAALVGLDEEVASRLLEQGLCTVSESSHLTVAVGGLRLQPGDTVVLTGEMDAGSREELASAARTAGLRVTGAVSGRTAVVVAGDPDSMSRKAREARARGVPIVGEVAFIRALDTISATRPEVGRMS